MEDEVATYSIEILADYLGRLKDQKVPFTISHRGSECVVVIVTTPCEHWKAEFHPDDRIIVSAYLSDEWSRGQQGLASVIAALGGTWPESPEAAGGQEVFATYLKFCAALHDLGVAYGHCDTICTVGGGLVLVVASGSVHWEIQFDASVRIDVEQFALAVTLEGEKALEETYDWWVRSNELDAAEVAAVKAQMTEGSAESNT